MSSEYRPIKSINIIKMNYILDRIFSSIIQDVNKLHYYVFHGRVTLFFADNFSTECRITMKFLPNFFQTVK